MPVDRFGRRDTAVQDNASSDVSFTQMDDFFSGGMDRIPPSGR